MFSIPISLDKSPLSIKKFFCFWKREFTEFNPFFVSILKYLFSVGNILQNLLMSFTEFVKDRA